MSILNISNNNILKNSLANNDIQTSAKVVEEAVAIQKNIDDQTALLQEMLSNIRSYFPGILPPEIKIQRKIGVEIIGFPANFTLWDALIFKVHQILQKYLLASLQEKAATLDTTIAIYSNGYLFSSVNSGSYTRAPMIDPTTSLTNLQTSIQNGRSRLTIHDRKRKAKYVNALTKAIFLLDIAKQSYGTSFRFNESYIQSVPDAFAERSAVAPLFSQSELLLFCEFCSSSMASLEKHTHGRLHNTTSKALELILKFLTKYKLRTHIPFQNETKSEFLEIMISIEEEREEVEKRASDNLVVLRNYLVNRCSVWLCGSLHFHLDHKIDHLLSCIFITRKLNEWQKSGENPLKPALAQPRKEPPIESVNNLSRACQKIEETIGSQIARCRLGDSPFLFNHDEENTPENSAKIEQEIQKMVTDCLYWHRAQVELQEVMATAAEGYRQIGLLLEGVVPDVRDWLTTKPEEEREKSAERISNYVYRELFQLLPFLVGLEQLSTFITVELKTDAKRTFAPVDWEDTMSQFLIPYLAPKMIESVYKLSPESLLSGLPPPLKEQITTQEEQSKPAERQKAAHPEENVREEELPITIHSGLPQIMKVVKKLPIKRDWFHGSHHVLVTTYNELLVIPTNKATLAPGTAHHLLGQIKLTKQQEQREKSLA